jgi:hypothetical protein
MPSYEGKVDNLNPRLVKKLGEDKRRNSGLPVLGSSGYENSLLRRINSYIRLMLGLDDRDTLYGDITVPDCYLEYKYSSDSQKVVNVNPEEFHNIFIGAVEKIAEEIGVSPYSVNTSKKVVSTTKGHK